jgi:hypothetical protein
MPLILSRSWSCSRILRSLAHDKRAQLVTTKKQYQKVAVSPPVVEHLFFGHTVRARNFTVSKHKQRRFNCPLSIHDCCSAMHVWSCARIQTASECWTQNVSASMRFTVTDTKLHRHSVDVDDGASVAHLKLLLTNMSLVPAGFVPNLVFQKRILGDDDSPAGIGFSCDRCISLVCVRSAAEGAAAQASQELSAPIKFNATPPEVAMVHFRDSFLHVQPHLTRCMKQIFVRKFGASNWLS